MLDTNEINIATVEIPERRRVSAREKYEALLKRGNFYDSEAKEWKSGEPSSERRVSFEQLLGVFLEAQFNNQKARNSLERLRQTDFYDSKRDLWKIENDMGNGDEDHTTECQLLGVLAETQFNPERAKEKLKSLKQIFYDSERNLWYHDEKHSTNQFHEAIYPATDQLIGILIESQFDKQSAKEKLEQLKQTQLYDTEKGQWNLDMESQRRFSQDQLLGILVEAQFDKDLAREQLEGLKQTPLYNPKEDIWEICMTKGQGVLYATITGESRTRILYLLVEHALEEPEIQEEPLPNLPVQRSF